MVKKGDPDRMYCVRCRAYCKNPDDVSEFKNKRGVMMRRGTCTNLREDTKKLCESRINSFIPKKDVSS